MKRHINFGNIEQFRNIVRDVQFNAQYKCKDENGEVILDRTAKAPVLRAYGSEKIHGTNAAVCYSNPDGLWVQSRENIITPEKDNAGCAFFVKNTEESWMKIIKELAKEYSIDLDKNIISIYFEWCGGNIQKNSCVSGLDKMAIIFADFKVSPLEPSETESSKWLPTFTEGGQRCFNVSSSENRIYNVLDFPTYNIDIDFERPDLAQTEISKLVDEIENNSGIAKAFGMPDNIGEGIVFTLVDERGNLLRFKAKGTKHSNSKVKTLKAVDNEREQAKIDFATYACPAWRLEQMWQKVFGIDNDKAELSMKSVGLFLKAVMSDIIKEESDVMVEKGFEPKDISNAVNKIAKQWYQEELNRKVMNTK